MNVKYKADNKEKSIGTELKVKEADSVTIIKLYMVKREKVYK